MKKPFWVIGGSFDSTFKFEEFLVKMREDGYELVTSHQGQMIFRLKPTTKGD